MLKPVKISYKDFRDAILLNPAIFTKLPAVIKKTLRLQPPLRIVARSVMADDEMGGFSLKKGDIIHIPIASMHRLSKYWKNPEGFDPTRLMKPFKKSEMQFMYMPFSLGEHSCIGMQFALLDAVIVMSMLVRRYKLDLTPGCSLKRDDFSAINQLNRDATVHVHKRTGAESKS